MKIREHHIIPEYSIHAFLYAHVNDDIRIEEITKDGYKVSYLIEYNTPELHMQALRTLIDEHRQRYGALSLTQEELAAMEYSISAIKTLVDMGVLK